MPGLEGEPHGECGTASKASVYAQAAAVLFQHLAHGRQSKARSKVFSGEQRLEDLAQVLFGNAWAIVTNVDFDAIAVQPRADGDFGRARGKFCRVVTPANHGFGGVAHEINQGPAQPALIK